VLQAPERKETTLIRGAPQPPKLGASALEVVPEKLVGVQLGGIAWQKVQLEKPPADSAQRPWRCGRDGRRGPARPCPFAGPSSG
jgi:hypothetical protein